MKAVSSEMMKEIDRRTIAGFGIAGELLMDRAGRGVAEAIRRLARLTGRLDERVRLFAGRGNNGGDAYVAARYLREWGFSTEVFLAATAAAVTGDALRHLDRMRAAGVPLQELPDAADWEKLAAVLPRDRGFVVDGLLGTGTSGPPREPVAAAIRCIRTLGQHGLVIAIDVPSGLNADTGQAPGDTVAADVTLTMAMPKTGLLEPSALNFVGNLEVVDIGVPDELVAEVESDVELVAAADLAPLFPPRARGMHKGSFGHVLVIAGSPGFSGAAVLAARAAVHSGVGLVSVLTPDPVAATVAAGVPEAMVHPAPHDDAGRLGPDAPALTMGEFDAILVGPGLTSGSGTVGLVDKLLAGCRVPLVLDADALNVCAGRPHIIRSATCPRVITPHPGEMARLLSCSTAEVQADRFDAARRAVAATGSVVVLKGGGTLVSAPGNRLAVNLTGNPGMATGGAGDVLAGLLAGLLAQGMTPFDAARAAVFLHGLAGDTAAFRGSQYTVAAGDLVDQLPAAYARVACR